jgi:hypothetical protein
MTRQVAKLDGLFKLTSKSLSKSRKSLKNANATTYQEVRDMDWEKL